MFTNIVPQNPGQGMKVKDPFPSIAISCNNLLSIALPKATVCIVGRFWYYISL